METPGQGEQAPPVKPVDRSGPAMPAPVQFQSVEVAPVKRAAPVKRPSANQPLGAATAYEPVAPSPGAPSLADIFQPMAPKSQAPVQPPSPEPPVAAPPPAAPEPERPAPGRPKPSVPSVPPPNFRPAANPSSVKPPPRPGSVAPPPKRGTPPPAARTVKPPSNVRPPSGAFKAITGDAPPPASVPGGSTAVAGASVPGAVASAPVASGGPVGPPSVPGEAVGGASVSGEAVGGASHPGEAVGGASVASGAAVADASLPRAPVASASAPGAVVPGAGASGATPITPESSPRVKLPSASLLAKATKPEPPPPPEPEPEPVPEPPPPPEPVVEPTPETRSIKAGLVEKGKDPRQQARPTKGAPAQGSLKKGLVGKGEAPAGEPTKKGLVDKRAEPADKQTKARLAAARKREELVRPRSEENLEEIRQVMLKAFLEFKPAEVKIVQSAPNAAAQIEERRAPRMKCEYETRCFVGLASFLTQVTEISLTGVRILTPERLTKDALIELAPVDPYGKLKAVRCKVAWCRKIDDDRLSAGLAFDDDAQHLARSWAAVVLHSLGSGQSE